MFCPKCGTQLENESHNCSSCDWSLGAEKSENDSTLEDSGSLYEQEKEIDTDNQVSETIITTEKNDVTLPKFKFDKKKLSILIIIVLILSVIIGVTIYHNSDSYKIKKSTELIVSGNYTEGANKIHDVYTPQAVAIKNFINIEVAKDYFINSVATDDLTDVSEAYWDFYNKLNDFNESDGFYYLTEDLKAHYNCYKYAFDCVLTFTNFEDSDIPTALYNVQEVMMNEVQKNNSSKNGDTFTLTELQQRVNQSESALKVLEKIDLTNIEITDTNIITYCHTSRCSDENGVESRKIFLSEYLTDIINTLISECESEIYSSQNSIDNALDEFEMDDDLYKTKPVSNYSSYVGINLDSIRSYDDISNNRDTMLNLLRRDLLFYLITGECVAINA